MIRINALDPPKDWYIRDVKKNSVCGPISVETVQKAIIAETISTDDEATQSGCNWEPVHQVPELIPEQLLKGLSYEYKE
jgi:hypothetical protein